MFHRNESKKKIILKCNTTTDFVLALCRSTTERQARTNDTGALQLNSSFNPVPPYRQPGNGSLQYPLNWVLSASHKIARQTP